MPAAARKGDTCVPHCSPFSTSGGSGDVFVNGRPMNRVGDPVTTHLVKQGKKCGPHTPSISNGSSSVFVNNRPAAYVGSSITSCTKIASGSPDVIVGR